MESPGPDLFHPLLKPLHIVDALGLDKIDPGFHLLGQPDHPELERVAEGIRRGPDEYPGLHNRGILAVLYFITADEQLLISHRLQGIYKLDGVKIEDILAGAVVAELLVIAGKAEDVLQPQGIGAQDIALDRDPVPVPAGYLDYRLQTLPEHQGPGGDRGHAYDGRLIVRDIYGIDHALQIARLFPDYFQIRALRRAELGGDRKMTRGKNPLQIAS